VGRASTQQAGAPPEPPSAPQNPASNTAPDGLAGKASPKNPASNTASDGLAGKSSPKSPAQQGVANEKTPLAEGGKKPMSETNPDRNTGGADPDRLLKRHQQAQLAQQEAENARRIAANKANVDQAVKTLPGPNEQITFDRAIQGIESQGWPASASMTTRSHTKNWRAHNPTAKPNAEVPVVFRDGNQIRIDFERLTAEQQSQLRTVLVRAVVGAS
jgi:hypothetical protein